MILSDLCIKSLVDYLRFGLFKSSSINEAHCQRRVKTTTKKIDCSYYLDSHHTLQMFHVIVGSHLACTCIYFQWTQPAIHALCAHGSQAVEANTRFLRSREPFLRNGRWGIVFQTLLYHSQQRFAAL